MCNKKKSLLPLIEYKVILLQKLLAFKKTNFCLEKGMFTAFAAATATNGTHLATMGGAFRE